MIELYSKGDKYRCHGCKAYLFELSRDIFVGEILSETMFIFEPNQVRHHGEETTCRLCGQQWFTGHFMDAEKIVDGI